MDPVIQIKNLSAGFNELIVLDGINLDIFSGEITVIVGHSGSGKTTLLRSINRLNDLFDGYYCDGEIAVRINNKMINIQDKSIDPAKLRCRMAMVFQTPNVLPVSIRKNFSLPLRLTKGFTRDEIEDKMATALKDVLLFDEVSDRLDKNASTLSGGQQQRLCLARAIALNPDALLLDEPTSSLDYKASRRIEELLSTLKEKYTIIAVSHSLGQTRRIADRCVVIKDGTIGAILDKHQLVESDKFKAHIEDVF